MGKSAFEFGGLIVSADLQPLVDHLRLCGWSDQAILAQLALGWPARGTQATDRSASAPLGPSEHLLRQARPEPSAGMARSPSASLHRPGYRRGA